MLIPMGLMFLLSQAPIFPITVSSGSEVRFVSLDLFQVFATGRVEEGLLTMVGTFPPGQQFRILIFSRIDGKDSGGEMGQFGKALTGVVSADGKSILMIGAEGQEAIDFGEWLEAKFGIIITLNLVENP